LPSVDLRDVELDTGHVAVLGHKILVAASVIAGAVGTLRDSEHSLSPAGRAVLEREIDRCVDSIVEASQWLVRCGAR
jgi:hypothetical protein